MRLGEFQKQIEKIYYEKDSARGVEGTFLWFCEEVGELARAIQKGDRERLKEEFADVAAWLFTLASLTGIDMEAAARKYVNGCPKCMRTPCACGERSSCEEVE